MSDDEQNKPSCCPKCGQTTEPKWAVCPQCGLRLRPAESVVVRALMWAGVLAGFVFLYLNIAKSDENLAISFLVIAGIPLAYVFGKALIFRWRGQPLTISEIARSGFRAGAFSVMAVVVVPFLFGAALILLLLVICAAGSAQIGIGH